MRWVAALTPRAQAALALGVLVLVMVALYGLAASVVGRGDPDARDLPFQPRSQSPVPIPARAAVDVAVPEGITIGSPEALTEWLAVTEGFFPDPAKQTTFGPMDAGAYASTGHYAAAFVEEALVIDYASQSWEDLMAWLQWEVAPLPPPTDEWNFAQDEMERFYVGLLYDRGLGESDFGLLPNRDVWAELAAAGARQQVSDVMVAADPKWESLRSRDLVAKSDPLSDCVRVHATLETVGAGRTETRPLSFRLCVGTATRHVGRGYTGVYEVRAER